MFSEAGPSSRGRLAAARRGTAGVVALPSGSASEPPSGEARRRAEGLPFGRTKCGRPSLVYSSLALEVTDC
jgi:hypothetical protein